MYELIIYQTKDGNTPIKQFYKELLKKHKKKDLDAIQLHLEHLKTYGPEINNKVKSNLVKPVRGGVFELRVRSNRILFLYYDGKKIVLLHGFTKKRNSIPQNEIETALKEMKEYKREKKS